MAPDDIDRDMVEPHAQTEPGHPPARPRTRLHMIGADRPQASWNQRKGEREGGLIGLVTFTGYVLKQR